VPPQKKGKGGLIALILLIVVLLLLGLFLAFKVFDLGGSGSPSPSASGTPSAQATEPSAQPTQAETSGEATGPGPSAAPTDALPAIIQADPGELAQNIDDTMLEQYPAYPIEVDCGAGLINLSEGDVLHCTYWYESDPASRFDMEITITWVDEASGEYHYWAQPTENSPVL
jgi:hypothetical protein